MTRRTLTSIIAIPAAGLTSLALGLIVTLPGCRAHRLELPPEPFGPIRAIRDLHRDAAALTGQMVRLRGRIVATRNLNPGQPFPWDVVYTLDDGTGTVPVHWFVQEPAPKDLKPPTLPGGSVIVTGKLKRDLELEGTRYPLLAHEQAEWHNQEHPLLPPHPLSQ
jgi:hypothetical protein